MYECWYDYIKPKYGNGEKLCYMDTDSFAIYIETEDFYKDIVGDVERQFDTSNYDENKTGKNPLSIGKNKKVIALFKDELGGEIMTEFVGIRAKAYAYLTDNYDLDDDDCVCKTKKAKGMKKCVIKRRLMFENYKDCLLNSKIILKPQERFKSHHQKVYTEKINKIALSNDDDKRLQTFDKITAYPHGRNAFKVCESEMLMVMKYKDFVPIETNKIFKTIVAKCILNRSIRYRKGEMLTLMKYKDFFLNNKIILKKQTRYLMLLLQSAW